MDNDAARHELTDVLALVQEQMADMAAIEKKRATLEATAESADGTVQVTVNAQAVVVDVVIDESYFDDHELADLGGHVARAAQAAASDVGRRTAELLSPVTERRARMPSLADVLEGAPDVRTLMAQTGLFGAPRSASS